MTRNALLIWRLGIVSLSLLAAIAVYGFARLYPPEVLQPLQVTGTDLATYTGIFGSAPSFFYTLALGLLIGVCASNHSIARLHCFIWIGLALFLELSQHPIIAESVSDWIKINFSDSIWTLIGPYWSRGVFDPLDLFATLMGGGVALYLLTRLPLEKRNVRD
jgi:hypothetical protein